MRFCTTLDGVQIAYAVVGQGPPLVKTANWLNHLEHDWESLVWRHLFHGLSRDHTLIRYDERGNGLSDWGVEDISFDAFVQDLETVVDAAGVERFPLLGISQGCAVSIAYAVRHPERVNHLILYGGFARGRRMRGDSDEIEQAQAMATLIRQGWGADNPAFRQLITQLLSQSKCLRLGRIADGYKINIGIGVSSHISGHGLQQQHQSLHAHGESGCRGRLATQLLYQCIVAPAGTDGTLCTQRVGEPFKDRPIVVVQAPNQPLVD